MHSDEKQVRQLLVNAEQSLEFLRTIIDDLLLQIQILSQRSKDKLIIAQRNYKKHKAVLLNIRHLLSNQYYPIPKRLCFFISNSLRRRLSLILEEAIELDKNR